MPSLSQTHPIVSIQNVNLYYHSEHGETKTLDNMSFDVSSGEFISIVGPSGCGKSTLLSLIAGLLAPTSGDIFLSGKKRAQSDMSIGYMLQKDHLFEWRTIQNNIFLGLEIQNKLTEENKAYTHTLLKDYGLYDYKDYFPNQLSGGMRQRVALIRTLAIKPDILLLDEPFSALDYQTRLHVSDDIGNIIKKEKKTAILVTHDISEAISLADRVVVLTNRPAQVRKIHEIRLSLENRTPITSREAPEFREYFNTIWKELDSHA